MAELHGDRNKKYTSTLRIDRTGCIGYHRIHALQFYSTTCCIDRYNFSSQYKATLHYLLKEEETLTKKCFNKKQDGYLTKGLLMHQGLIQPYHLNHFCKEYANSYSKNFSSFIYYFFIYFNLYFSNLYLYSRIPIPMPLNVTLLCHLAVLFMLCDSEHLNSNFLTVCVLHTKYSDVQYIAILQFYSYFCCLE